MLNSQSGCAREAHQAGLKDLHNSCKEGSMLGVLPGSCCDRKERGGGGCSRYAQRRISTHSRLHKSLSCSIAVNWTLVPVVQGETLEVLVEGLAEVDE